VVLLLEIDAAHARSGRADHRRGPCGGLRAPDPASEPLRAAGAAADVRIALGGVGTVPWRARKAEDALRGLPATEALFRTAADAELADARPLAHNTFKLELTRRTIAAVLGELAS